MAQEEVVPRPHRNSAPENEDFLSSNLSNCQTGGSLHRTFQRDRIVVKWLSEVIAAVGTDSGTMQNQSASDESEFEFPRAPCLLPSLHCYHLPGVPMTHMSEVVQQLKKEREHVQKQVQRIDAALAALGGANSNGGSRTMSAAPRRRISLAQKARWAKQPTGKPRRTISAAGRRRIAAAQRARWAKFKARKPS